ncbi:MAG: hypothetical protein FJ026_08885 [Chloroflexi bacterium]|nr:hypothetical protein [Chloroflexota bacterium]
MTRGLLGTRATLVADLNLILQIVILIVLAISVFQGRRRGMDRGRILVTVAVAINAVLIIAVMNPSFFRILPFALHHPAARGPRLVFPHVVLGTLAELTGVYLVLSPNRDSAQTPHLQPTSLTTRTAFRVMLVLWAAALVIGLLVYSVLYM